MSDYVELYMDQGADFSITVQMNSEDNNMAQNLSGYIVTSQMRKSYLSQNATFLNLDYNLYNFYF